MGKEIGGGVERRSVGDKGLVAVSLSKLEKGLKVVVGETGGEGSGRSRG
jgi:hypothetical protein